MKLVYGISTVNDGSMSVRQDQTNKDEVVNNRTVFLAKYNIKIQDCTRVTIAYGGDDYLRYFEVDEKDKGEGMFDGNSRAADALVTRQPGHALFLPLADCVGAVIFDPVKQILMMSHIGRHSLEQFGATASVKFLIDKYGCHPEQLIVWLTPAPGPEKYPLFAFDNRGFKDVVLEQLQSAGIKLENVNDDSTDTTIDQRFYSHSQFLAGQQADDGRYAIVAMMRQD